MTLAAQPRNPPTRRRRPTAGGAARGFRTDIQALRAVAIAAVVLNHLWPGRLPGGYVGVDVFFVISGFLITSHLCDEHFREGRIRLGAFYARRIRRLLPAALLVLAVSAVLVFLFLPYPRWERNAWEIAASAFYVENWLLAGMSVNYSAANDAASVAQHYWSLSVEEQFYLVWPLLIAVAGWAALRAGRGRHKVMLAVLSAVVGLSLVSSLVYTAVAPSEAYFATFTRAWEFGIGAILALVGSRLTRSRVAAQLLSGAGLVAIAIAAFSFDEHTVFPGAAALLPALGTAAVIAAGAPGHSLWHTPLTASRPVQWLGGVSYSLYLWHWPLIVVAPFTLKSELTTPLKFAVLVAALLLAWATRIWVEQGAMKAAVWRTSTPRSVLGMAVGMVVVGTLAVGLTAAHSVRAAADSPTAALAEGPCVGPAALRADAACDEDPFGPADSVVMTAANEYWYTPPECGELLDVMTYGEKRTTRVCDYSDGAADAPRVWLVGDSHAQQWQAAVLALAQQRGWHLTMSYFGGCPAADVAFTGFRGAWGPADAEACQEWSRDVAAAIEADAPEMVFTSMAARLQGVDDGSGRTHGEQFESGLLSHWTRWTAAGSEVFVIADPPLNAEVRDPDCVQLHASDPRACAVERSVAQPTDPLAAAAAASADAAVHLIDLTARFCDEESCYAVVGGVPVYFDADHLNLTYVRMLVPDFEELVDAATAS